MKRHVLAVCAILALVSGAAHAIPFDRIPLISNTLGDVQNRLCSGAATPAGQADIACPSYSPYLTSGGLLGVGTSAPSATIHILNTGATRFAIDHSAGGNTRDIEVSGSYVTLSYGYRPNDDYVLRTDSASRALSIGGQAFIKFTQTGTGPLMETSNGTSIMSELWDATNGGIIRVGHGNSFANIDFTQLSQALIFNTSSTERARINSSGNFGIGTQTPTTALEVSGTISATHFVGDGSGLTNLSVQGDRITSGTTNVTVNSATSTISFTTNGSVANYIDSSGRLVTTGISVTTNQLSATTGYFSGNVGIGTTSPNYKLDVSGSIGVGNNNNSSTNRINLASGDNYHYIYSTGSSGNNTYFGEYGGNFHFYDTSTNGDRLAINGAIVTVNGAIQFGSGGSAGAATIYQGGGYLTVEAGSNGLIFTNANSAQPFLSASTGNANGIAIGTGYALTYTAPTNGMIVQGNVGIGTTSPSRTLHVSGTVLTTSWTGINFSSTGNVTPTVTWPRLFGQFSRFDKWNVCQG